MHLPDPRHEHYRAAVHDELVALIGAAGGRTLALFTSWKAMDLAAAAVRERVEVPILTQRDLPKPALVARFAADESTCIFATAGFFQGVDVPGRTLSLVVIDRLPFPRPDDPLLSARRELLGPTAFAQIDIPRAAMLLAQASGRLIRNATDRGVVAVLDRRLGTARYRWDIVKALPPMRRTRDRAEVERFLAELTADRLIPRVSSRAVAECLRRRASVQHGTRTAPKHSGQAHREPGLRSPAMTDEAELVHVAVGDGVATITLDSPANRNALSIRLVTDLNAALDVAEAGIGDGSVRAIVVTHVPPAFCAGADLKERRLGAAGLGADGPSAAPADGRRGADDRRRQGRGAGRRHRADGVVRPRRRAARPDVRARPRSASASPRRSSPCPILRRASGSRLAAALLTGEVFDAEFARDVGLVTHVDRRRRRHRGHAVRRHPHGRAAGGGRDEAPAAHGPDDGARRGVRAHAPAVRRAVRRPPTPPRAWPRSPRSARRPGSRA